jgi:hypothetical protein
VRRILFLVIFLLMAQAQAPYAVEGLARYRGYYPLGSWEGKNLTAQGEVVWDGLEKASGRRPGTRAMASGTRRPWRS